MSKAFPKSPPTYLVKCLSFAGTSLIAAAGIFALAQTKHAPPMTSRTAAMLLRPLAMVLPGANDYWHTEGPNILDRQNQPVHIAGVNWSGFETKEAVPGGLDVQDYQSILETIKKNGFNTIRIPLSNEMVETPTVPKHIRFTNDAGPINTELRNLTSIEILDRIIDYAGQIGLKVILDNHRSEAGSSAEENGLWYTPLYPESAWIDDWTSLAHRYQNNSTVIGMDLRNEPHNADRGGACWDCGGAHDWHLAAERAGNAILVVNPRLLIFVEGVDNYLGDTSWWGGNLEGVRHSPIHLSIPGRLVYSVHEYGPTEYSQAWFNASTSPATLTSMWRHRWAYISEAGIAPVWIGEFGTPNTDADVYSSIPGSEGQWFYSLIEFLHTHPGLGWAYWGINGEDRYGLLDANYMIQANNKKFQALANIHYNTAEHVRSLNIASGPVTTRRNPVVPRISPQPAIDLTPTFATGSSNQLQAPEVSLKTNATAGHRGTRSADPTVKSAIAADIRQAVRTADLSLEGDVRTLQR